MLEEWHAARHGSPLPECMLPPLGFVVEDERGACAALFCYQSYGVGVAFIDHAFSRPKLSMKKAIEAFWKIMLAIMLACEDTHRLFRVCSNAAIARVLLKMGFQKAPEQNLTNLFYLN